MIEASGISKSFGSNAVLRAVDLTIADGEFFCLLGPSGCGKTTLLRVVAGLEKPDTGTVRVGGRDVSGAPPHLRGCALVFQNYALWPHLSVAENIVYGLEVQRRPKPEIKAALDGLLKAYQLQGLESRYPHQLSGGQQQRVALARAMAVQPHALLMDEPLSNLDAALRKTLRRELLEFHRRAGGTILYVTHDQEEALALSDRIAVMMEGNVVEMGRPADLYARPKRLETALFLGDMNVLRGDRIPRALRGEGGPAAASSGASALCIRPENVKVSRSGGPAREQPGAERPAGGKPAGDGNRDVTQGTGPAEARIPGALAFAEFMGTHATLGIETASGLVLARASIAEAAALEKGCPLELEFPPEHRLWY